MLVVNVVVVYVFEFQLYFLLDSIKSIIYGLCYPHKFTAKDTTQSQTTGGQPSCLQTLLRQAALTEVTFRSRLTLKLVRQMRDTEDDGDKESCAT